MNKVTRADVEVQPYAFTTKSLFVGHMDYKYLRWQVIDTPGILDHSLEERNTIEMQAITALAHIRSAVLYIMDLSEQCNHSIEEQIELFNNIRPLFTNKPILVCLNKIDIVAVDDLPEEKKKLLDEAFKDEGVTVIPMSTLTEEGVMAVRTDACDRLLTHRVEVKMKSKKMGEIINRLHVSMPAARDAKERPVFIPEGVAKKGKGMDVDKPSRKLAKEYEKELGEDYKFDDQKLYKVHPDEKYDIIPEMIDGKNITDFVDPEIMERLDELEREEELREAAGVYDEEIDDMNSEEEETQRMADEIRKKKKIRVQEHRAKKGSNYPTLPRKASLRLDRFGRPQKRKADDFEFNIEGDIEMMENGSTRVRSLSKGNIKRRKKDASVAANTSRDRSLSQKTPRDKSGIRDPEKRAHVRQLSKVSQRKMNQFGKAGEADRKITTKMPKHLFSGKRKAGKTQRR